MTRGKGLRVARIVLIRYGGMFRYENDHHERKPVSSSWIPRHGRMLTSPCGEARYRASQETEEVGGECGSLYYHFHRKEWVRCGAVLSPRNCPSLSRAWPGGDSGRKIGTLTLRAQ